MSSFNYNNRATGYTNEICLAVKCDICGNVLWTERTGSEFPLHITKDAREAGWAHRKAQGEWVDLCPDCLAFEQQKKREDNYEH